MAHAKNQSLSIFLLFLSFIGLAQGSEKKDLGHGAVAKTVNASPNDAKKHTSVTNQGSDEEATQIGNSYFQKKPEDANAKVISQLGAAYEAHRNYSEAYAFLNQYFPNQIFYELRLIAISRHLLTPLQPPLVPNVISQSEVNRMSGYGLTGIVGYNFIGSPIISFLPFIRLQTISNTSLAYGDIYGNRIHSMNYAAYLGGKVSIQLCKPLAIYAQYYGGYQSSPLSGSGVYYTKPHALVNSYPSYIEFGTPFKVGTAWNITPYLQLIYAPNRPNQTAQNKPYDIKTNTVSESVYAIKVSYAF